MFYGIFPEIVLYASNKCKRWLYRNTNPFFIAQIVSKSRTSGRIMGIVAVLIVSALVTMFVGGFMGQDTGQILKRNILMMLQSP